MDREPKLPDGAYRCNGEVVSRDGSRLEIFDGKWCRVVDASREGWWRFHKHYDRDGYCDNPARGY